MNDSWSELILIAIIFTIISFLIGAKAFSEVVQNDCKNFERFRSGDVVYECKPKATK